MLDLKILCHPLPGKDYVTSGVGEAIFEFIEWDCVKGRGHNGLCCHIGHLLM